MVDDVSVFDVDFAIITTDPEESVFAPMVIEAYLCLSFEWFAVVLQTEKLAFEGGNTEDNLHIHQRGL